METSSVEASTGVSGVIEKRIRQVVFVIVLCVPVRRDSRGLARRESLRQEAEHA